MNPSTQIWIETWEPAGVVRADRVLRLWLRRGCNTALPEIECGDAVSDMSFCAEVESGDGPLLLGCTDDVASASAQLAELVDTLARAARDGVDGPVFVARSDRRPRDGSSWWSIGPRFPRPDDGGRPDDP